MPESEDESQEIAAKGLLCSVRYPGSDLSRLRMIWRPHAELERFRGGQRRAQSARSPWPCPVACEAAPNAGRRIRACRHPGAALIVARPEGILT